MKILHTACLTWKIINKNPFLWILVIAYFLYLFMGIDYYTSGNDYSPGETLTQMSFLIQGGILAFLLFGVMFIRIEERHYLNDIFKTIHHGSFHKISGKLIFSIIFIFILISASYVMFAFKLWFTGTELSTFYWSAYQYIILYWGLTFLISLLIGCLLAYIIKGKLVYPILIFIWALIGPANKFLLGNSASKLGADKILSLLNLGEPNPYAIFNAFYGFPLSEFHWAKKLLWILCLIAIFSIIYLIKNQLNKKIVIVLIVSILLLMPSIHFLTLDRQIYVSASSTENARENYDYNYYSAHPESLDNIRKTDVTINDYKINLNIDRVLEATVSMSVVNNEKKPLKQITLSLYHNFKIKQASVNNKPVNVKQNRDFFTVKLDQSLDPGDNVDVQVSYRGTSSPNFFANRQAIYLPYYFPWLPSSLQKPAFNTSNSGELLRNNHQLEEQAQFTLNYDGNQQIYTNLSRVNNHVWKGKADHGLTLAAGEINKTKFQEDILIQPNSWPRHSAKDIEMLKQANHKLIQAVSENLGLDLHDPNKVLYLPILSIRDHLSSQRIWYTEDYMIYGQNSGYQQSLMPEPQSFYAYWAVPALTWKHSGVDESPFARYFGTVFAYVYNKQHHIPDEGELLPDHLKGDQQKIEALSAITNWVTSFNDYEKMNNFLNDWFKLVKKDEQGWGQLLELIKQYR
ncbi:hypothetical protein GCM10028778_27370 [Barrientosiimonas marina]|uniref:ABC transporter permease n=1 Tax=Lentibacillus kimchii TaxID=1542911 RepID=A0ABW2UUA7_9BACI